MLKMPNWLKLISNPLPFIIIIIIITIMITFVKAKVQKRLINHKNSHGNNEKEQSESEAHGPLSSIITSPIGCREREQHFTDVKLRNTEHELYFFFFFAFHKNYTNPKKKTIGSEFTIPCSSKPNKGYIAKKMTRKFHTKPKFNSWV